MTTTIHHAPPASSASTPASARRAWRVLALALTAAMGCLGLAACSSNGGEEATTVVVDEDAPPGTPALLASAADASATSQSSRFEMWMTMKMHAEGQGMTLAPSEPLLRGMSQGDAQWFTVDLGALMESAMLAAGASGPDVDAFLALGDRLSMEMVVTPTAQYLRAPMFGALAELGALPTDDLLAPMLQLADRWGRIDPSQLSGVLPSDVAGMLTGTQAADPQEMLDVLREVAVVEDRGPAVVRDVGVNVYAATVSMGQMLEAQGMDRDAFAELLGGGVGEGGDPALDALFTSMLDLELPFEVAVDSDGRVRRMDVELDFAELFRSLEFEELVGEEVPADFTFSMDMRMELFDYDDPSIAVAVPADSDTVDLTAWMLQVVEAGGLDVLGV